MLAIIFSNYDVFFVLWFYEGRVVVLWPCTCFSFFGVRKMKIFLLTTIAKYAAKWLLECVSVPHVCPCSTVIIVKPFNVLFQCKYGFSTKRFFVIFPLYNIIREKLKIWRKNNNYWLVKKVSKFQKLTWRLHLMIAYHSEAQL